MAGAMRKLGLYLGLVEDDEEQGRRDYDRELDRDVDQDYAADYGPGDHRYADDYSEDYAASPPRAGYGEVDEPTALRRHQAEPEPRTRVTAPTRGALAVDPTPRRPPAPREQRVSALGDDVAHRITALHPRTYNDARQIGEAFRDGVPVIMNLTEMDDADAKRLVDFAAGLIFGLRGSIEKVTNKVFLLSPRDVQVTAEDKARLAEGGFFNQS